MYSGYFALPHRNAFSTGVNPAEIIVLTKDLRAYYAPTVLKIAIPANGQGKLIS